MFEHVQKTNKYSKLVLSVYQWVYRTFRSRQKRFVERVVEHVLSIQNVHLAYEVRFGRWSCVALFSPTMWSAGNYGLPKANASVLDSRYV